LEAREEKLGDEENQALATHAKKGKSKKEVHSHKKPHGLQKNHKFKKDFSSYRCFICQKIGHIAIIVLIICPVCCLFEPLAPLIPALF
jgi:hypothetical protein